MKTAIIFVIIVVIGFLTIYMITKPQTQNQEQSTNFLTPTPTPTVSLNAPTAGPTVAENQRVSASKATIKTEKGNIEFVLYPQDAPKTVTNFATLSKNGYYNNLTFHRVESWVVQGGDPTGTGKGGSSIYGETFEDELNPETQSYKEGYVEGVLAMANRGPNTNGSQFFILTRDTPLDPAYTIFGKVTSGMDIVKSIKQGDKILSIDVQ